MLKECCEFNCFTTQSLLDVTYSSICELKTAAPAFKKNFYDTFLSDERTFSMP